MFVQKNQARSRGAYYYYYYCPECVQNVIRRSRSSSKSSSSFWVEHVGVDALWDVLLRFVREGQKMNFR
jgi:predicted RNA-binding Zn-ribbon protein involved in translation (DUF1610 family)